jgi:predicted alpha/beta-fold hydrolase
VYNPKIILIDDFTPPNLLRNPHFMTLAAAYWPRTFPQLSAPTPRNFEVEPGSSIRGDCHWQPDPKECPAMILVHGLEGSSDSNYMRGTAEKAFIAGFSVVRLNQRNCGGSEKLTPTLYNSGLSGDCCAVVKELIERDSLSEILAVGFSMGGNLVMKMAGDMGPHAPPELRGVMAICPSLNLASCADAVGAPRNFIYQWHFVKRLKGRMRYKASLYPHLYVVDGMRGIRSVRAFDDAITAKYCGFESADDYYARSSASRVAAEIRVPTLVLISQDDPMIPIEPFRDPALLGNPNIEVLETRYGGHCAYISKSAGPQRFWAETKIMEFCSAHRKNA